MAITIDPTAILTESLKWLFIVGAGVILAVVVFFAFMALYKLLRYRIRITIIDHVGDSHLIRQDMAQEVNEKGGKNYLKLLKSKISIPVPNPDKYLAMGLKKQLFLHKHNDLFTPMLVSHNSPANFEFKMDDLVSVLFWREQDHQEALDTYRDRPGFWDRYQQPILFMSFMMIQFVLFFILFQKLGDLSISVDTTQFVK